MESAVSHQLIRKGKSMAILTGGIDLAKNVFAVHGVNEAGRAEPFCRNEWLGKAEQVTLSCVVARTTTAWESLGSRASRQAKVEQSVSRTEPRV